VLARFRFLVAFTNYELFVSFRSLDFGLKINRINPLLVIISSNYLQQQAVYTSYYGVADYSKRQLKTVRFPI